LAPHAQAAPGQWQPGPEAILDNTYAGVVDLPVDGSTVQSTQPIAVSGWVVDQTADGWAGIDNVHVYEGLAGAGGTLLGQASFAQSRPDVGEALGNPLWSNSGFGLTLAAGTLSPGAHTLGVYAHTPGKGWWFTQVSVTITPPPPSMAAPVNVIIAPQGTIIGQNQDHYPITGYALDPNSTSGSGIDRVEVYLDEQRGDSDSQFIGLAQLGDQPPQAVDAYGQRAAMAGYRIDFKPYKFIVGNHHIYSYAHSSITGQETLAIGSVNLKTNP
jgi:hypothetical protein